MGLQIKKSALAVIALGLSGVASAAMYTPAPAPTPVCNPTNVTVPCERSAWDVGLEAILVEPSSDDNWIYAQSYSRPGREYIHERQSFDPGYLWGWRLEGSYHFGTGSDVNLNWMHFNEDTSNDVEDPVNGVLVTPYISRENDNYSGSEIDGSLNTKFDQVNFEFGQHADFGHNYNVRFHFGLQYARIDVSEAVGTMNDANSINYGYANESKLDGVGVRAGLDTAYDFGNGFSLEGKGGMALLVGDMKTSTALIKFNNGDDTNEVYTWTGSQRHMLPELEASADVKYTHAMANGDVSFYLGWRFINYFNAVQTVLESTSAGANSEDQTEIRNSTNSFAFQGPMAGLKWVGNI